MSLPKRLYDLYRQISQCQLVQSENVNDETLTEFHNLLNESQPGVDDVEEKAYSRLTKAMYHSNPTGFIKYVSVNRNRVGSLILWTESKRIIRYFGLQGRVHLNWDNESQKYVATRHVRQNNTTHDGYVYGNEYTRDRKVNPVRTRNYSNRRDMNREPRFMNRRTQDDYNDQKENFNDSNPFEKLNETVETNSVLPVMENTPLNPATPTDLNSLNTATPTDLNSLNTATPTDLNSLNTATPTDLNSLNTATPTDLKPESKVWADIMDQQTQ
jgi:hypothetical protein